MPAIAKEIELAGPAFSAATPGRMKIPAPIIVPPPRVIASTKPRLRANSLPSPAIVLILDGKSIHVKDALRSEYTCDSQIRKSRRETRGNRLLVEARFDLFKYCTNPFYSWLLTRVAGNQ